MTGRLSAVSGKTYSDVIRERFGFKFYVVPLTSELIANAFMLAADLGGIAIALAPTVPLSGCRATRTCLGSIQV